ncbi:MAG: SMC-Scp complex subunit ScpB, partial [Planctomycetales bacterium]|nr:SMC-Scp complex subunit ScpB [Planctomycetales bacterium]
MQDEKTNIESMQPDESFHGQAEFDRATQPKPEILRQLETPQQPEAQAQELETPRPDDVPPEPVHRETPDETDEPEEEPEDVENPVEIEATLETVVEAVLFASDEPLSPQRLVEIAEAGSVKDIRAAVKSLNAKYRSSGAAFRIEKISGGYQMMTLSAFNPWITKLIKVRSDNKLTPAGLETLAIVAYKQPIIRADIEAIRGVACGEVLRNLMYKGLVKIVGRAEILGRPMLYGTTKKFLDVFGLNTLK